MAHGPWWPYQALANNSPNKGQLQDIKNFHFLSSPPQKGCLVPLSPDSSCRVSSPLICHQQSRENLYRFYHQTQWPCFNRTPQSKVMRWPTLIIGRSSHFNYNFKAVCYGVYGNFFLKTFYWILITNSSIKHDLARSCSQFCHPRSQFWEPKLKTWSWQIMFYVI